MMNKLRNRKGFNLTELLVVIVILGILVMLALPRYFGSIADAKREACKANIKSINVAVAAYMAKHQGAVPTTGISDLVGAGDDKYFDVLPTCPAGGPAYTLATGNKTVDTTGHTAH